MLNAWLKVFNAHQLEGCKGGKLFHLELFFQSFFGIKFIVNFIFLFTGGRSNCREDCYIHAILHILFFADQLDLTLSKFKFFVKLTDLILKVLPILFCVEVKNVP